MCLVSLGQPGVGRRVPDYMAFARGECLDAEDDTLSALAQQTKTQH